MAKKSEVSDHEYNHEYDYKKQKAIKPAVEILVEQIMEEDAKKEFLLFNDYLKQQKMLVRWFVTNSYNINYKGCKLAQIYIYDGKDKQYRWRIKINTAHRTMFNEYLDVQTDEIIDLFMKNFKECTKCSSCAPGYSFDFFGKRFENICGTNTFLFVNPNADQMETIKKLIDARKEFCIKMKSMGIYPGT